MINQFIAAAKNGDTVAIAACLKQGTDVNTRNAAGDTALIWAAHEGHFEMVKLLLENEADPNLKDNLGNTALHWAARNDHQKINELLFHYKADKSIVNHNLLTPIEFASAYSRELARSLEITVQKMAKDLEQLKAQMQHLQEPNNSPSNLSNDNNMFNDTSGLKQKFSFFSPSYTSGK